jgi:hypothetical protein
MHIMIKTARQLRALGLSVYVPCNDFLEGLVDGGFDYEDYFKNSQPWLECADFIFVCSNWETSEGTKREVARAMEMGIPVFYDITSLKYAINHHGI